MPTKPTKLEMGGLADAGSDCYLMMRFFPLALFFPAPLEVILLVCINSPIYLGLVRRATGGWGQMGHSRLEKFVAAFELLVLRLYNLDAVDDFQ